MTAGRASGPPKNRFARSGRYTSGYLNAGQPTPSIGLGVYGVVLACAREGWAGALAALFALAGVFAGFFAVGFFALFLGVLFFFVGFAMPRNLPHAPSGVKPNGCRYRAALWRRPSTAGAIVPRRVTASRTIVARSGPLSGPTSTRPRAKAVSPSPPRRM